VILYGDGKQTRDFTFVSDAVEANLQAYREGGEPGIVLNIGGGTRTSVEEVLRIMGEITGRTVQIRHQPVPAGDVRHTGADTARARASIGYQPKVALADGLKQMDAWMRRYLEGLPE
jgi:nucleoside-diphosphate-sugar epimerase